MPHRTRFSSGVLCRETGSRHSLTEVNNSIHGVDANVSVNEKGQTSDDTSNYRYKSRELLTIYKSVPNEPIQLDEKQKQLLICIKGPRKRLRLSSWHSAHSCTTANLHIQRSILFLFFFSIPCFLILQFKNSTGVICNWWFSFRTWISSGDLILEVSKQCISMFLKITY